MKATEECAARRFAAFRPSEGAGLPRDSAVLFWRVWIVDPPGCRVGRSLASLINIRGGSVGKQTAYALKLSAGSAVQPTHTSLWNITTNCASEPLSRQLSFPSRRSIQASHARARGRFPDGS